ERARNDQDKTDSSADKFTSTTEQHPGDHAEDGADHKGTDKGGTDLVDHDASFSLPAQPWGGRRRHAAGGASASPRVRKARIFGSGEVSRRVLGLPTASMVLVSASRKTPLSPMVKMLANSCVTTTTVAPRLSRNSRIKS